MVISSFTRWFSCPAPCAAPGERPPVVALPFASPRPPRRSAAAPAVEVVIDPRPDGLVLRIKGEAGVDCAGALLDGLLAPGALRPAFVTLDLSELRCISSLAMGILVGYRRGVVRRGGRVRLAGPLQPEVREALARAELFDLFEPDTGSAGPGANRLAGAAPCGMKAIA